MLSNITGREGTVKIPALGVVIGRMVHWSLKRRGDGSPYEGLYDLRAVLSYSNDVLFNHPEYADKREIRIRLGNNQDYRLDAAGPIRLDGMNLTMEGVSLWRL